MRVLVLGGNGMLGHKLVQELKHKFDIWTTVRNKEITLYHPDIFEFQKVIGGVDAESFTTVEMAVNKSCPNVIVNAVGIIKQLPDSKNIIKTLTINSIFPHQLLKLTQKKNIRLINISTDCVFSGTKGNYNETNIADALDLYGKSKNLGEVISENNCLTLRTSIIGRELKTSHSLVEWFLSQTGNKVKGYKNAIFSGFPTIVLADILADLIVNYKKMHGLYHVSSQPISKYDLLNLLKKAYRVKVEIEPFEDFRIDRSLDSTKFRKETNFQPTSWEEMIKKMSDDPFPYHEFRK